MCALAMKRFNCDFAFLTSTICALKSKKPGLTGLFCVILDGTELALHLMVAGVGFEPTTFGL